MQDRATSTVQWSPPLAQIAPPSQELINAIKKLVVRKAIADRSGTSLNSLYAEWGDTCNVRIDLFYVASDGCMYPKYEATVQKWKAVVHDYCEWHGIADLDSITDLWCSLSDAFMACPNFDSEVDPEFRAWLYGCMCKFVLEEKKQRRTKQEDMIARYAGKYSPDHPHY